MDHSELVTELPVIERMTPAERIALAKERRATQLERCRRREQLEQKRLLSPMKRTHKLSFGPEIALLEATSRGDNQEVQLLLDQGANPNSHNEDGLTPLHQCAIDNNEGILSLLLLNGADVNSQDTEQWTPLHAAACCAHIGVVRLLIDNHANLVAVNADGNMPYDICDDDFTLDVIETEMGAQGITQEFIDEQRGAAEMHMLNDMKALHRQGRPDALDRRQTDGASFLHIAAANGYYDVAAFLLRCGASHSARDNDLWQPTHAAACWAQPDLVELIAEYGADINAKNAAGETPLDLCEDQNTRAVILTVQQTEARKRRQAFGVRDSRRQSRKRKKFESPQPLPATSDSLFSARGAIRRLSLRDRSGLTPARLEAQMEQTDILRSWSKEDLFNDKNENGLSPNDTKSKRDSVVRRLRGKNTSTKSPDEWLKKLETDNRDSEEDQEENDREKKSKSKQKKQKKKINSRKNGEEDHERCRDELKSRATRSRTRRCFRLCCVIS